MLNGLLMVGFLPQAWGKTVPAVRCVVCGGEVDWDIVKEIFDDILTQADMFGVESLTEHAQVVYNGQCCSEGCFDNLE